MKLKAKGRYSNEPLGVAYEAGQVFEVDEAMANLLMADSPGSFEEYKEPAKRATKQAAVTKDSGK